MFKRKIYDELIEWKNRSKGQTALLIEGARRVGKTTIAKYFGDKNFPKTIIFDFSKNLKDTNELFERGIPIEYALKTGVYDVSYNSTTIYWLRSPGYSEVLAKYVRDTNVLDDGYGVDRSDFGIRPIIKILK